MGEKKHVSGCIWRDSERKNTIRERLGEGGREKGAIGKDREQLGETKRRFGMHLQRFGEEKIDSGEIG